MATQSKPSRSPEKPLDVSNGSMIVSKVEDLQNVESCNLAPYGRHRILLITRGEAFLQQASKRYSCRAKSLILMSRHTRLKVRFKQVSGWSIEFEDTFLRKFLWQFPLHELSILLDQFREVVYLHLDQRGTNRISQLSEMLATELISELNRQLVQQYFNLVLLEAGRELYVGSLRIDQDSTSALFRDLKRLIAEHFQEKRSVGFYCENLGLNPRKLNGIAKTHTGKLVSEIINNRLLMEAESLLIMTDLSVKEIAHQLGFSDQSHFGVYFKKHRKLSAMEFRQLMQNHNNKCAG